MKMGQIHSLSARKEIVLALGAPSATPVVQPKGRKRKCARGNDGDSSQQEGLNLASGFRGKFVSLIDGMIGECGFEVSRLARDLTEMQGKLSESEAVLNATKDFHSAKVSKLEVQIGELERDLEKTASSLLMEKKARKTKSSEARPLQRWIESGEGSTNHGVEEAKDALRVEFPTRLAKISGSLGSLECIRSRDLALATVDGGMAVVQALQGETPSIKSECFLPTCSEDPEGQDLVVGENRGGAAPRLDEVMGEGESECFLPTCSEDPEGQDLVVGENRGGAAPRLDEVMGEGEWNAIFVVRLENFPQSPNFVGFLRTLNISIEACFRISYLLISYLEMLKISVLGLEQDLGLLLALRGAMTNSTYVSRYSFDLIRYRFKVRDRFSAYMTCLVGIEHLSKDNF
ncbi:hypothetical protein F2Q70_00021523 [Brassica cretica]|uniref:Uncharacterized protein n=1 Tax=Brassica cretica TaxID=69181 RepID=A0A8S9GN18_BRACR|nr:hypothetical protein F2Q70_00021523 [Brassica cretica]